MKEKISRKSPSRKFEPKPSSSGKKPVSPVGSGKAGCSCGGGCPRCSGKKASTLTVGAADHRAEREAEAVARRVTAGGAGASPSREVESVTIRRSQYLGKGGDGSFDPGTQWESDFQKIQGKGKPMEPGLQTQMESQFGRDFSDIRIHQGSDAHRSAREIGARAYTQGSHLVFGRGQYAPHTPEGGKRLAHELTHAVQQPRGSTLVQRDPDPALDSQLSFLNHLGGPDPIHGPLIEDFRRRNGLPPGGVDPLGNPVGPSDFEIKTFMLGPPLCPYVENLEKMVEDVKDPVFRQAYIDANCLSPASRSLPPLCRFSGDQEKMLKDSQALAAERMANAALWLKAPNADVQDMAFRLFAEDPPTREALLAVAETARDFLKGSGVRYEGRTCGDEACNDSAVAYVTGPGKLPIYICPTAFSYPGRLHQTVMHESIHWAGIDADPSTPEGYCSKFDCVTPCLGKDAADAWMNFLDCLGRRNPPAAKKP